MSKNLELKIESLEKRVKNLEELVNDLSVQIDRPVRDQKLDGKKKNPQLKTLEHNISYQEAAKEKLESEINRVINYLCQGEKRTEIQIREDCNLSGKAFARVRKKLKRLCNDNNPTRGLTLFWLENENK